MEIKLLKRFVESNILIVCLDFTALAYEAVCMLKELPNSSDYMYEWKGV
jgi:hypothetical protein